jgi:hypothetical protein
MPSSPHAAVANASALSPGLATGIGSLPFTDAEEAADLTLELHPHLPATPQLALPREGVVAQWAGALPEVTVAADGSLTVDPDRVDERVHPAFGAATHTGLVTFLDVAAALPRPPARIKTQLVGPLTLGVALVHAGLPADRAFERAAVAVRAWARALEARCAETLPGVPVLLFLDEPALVLWRRNEAPIEREQAIDVLSNALAGCTAVTGVHVCGDGDVRIAFEAGPRVLGLPVSEALLADGDAIVRHLDADGWVAWGAVPTDRPVGDSADPLWRRLVTIWCDLTRRGCDPVGIRTHAIVTPACGLAGHGPSQAARALRLAQTMADRIGDQAVAARLTVGA